jgi:hypothetical protein
MTRDVVKLQKIYKKLGVETVQNVEIVDEKMMEWTPKPKDIEEKFPKEVFEENDEDINNEDMQVIAKHIEILQDGVIQTKQKINAHFNKYSMLLNDSIKNMAKICI